MWYGLFADYLDQDPFFPFTVKFAVKDLFPRAKIQFTVGYCYDDLPSHELSFNMGISICFAGEILVSAHIVKGHRVTSAVAVRDQLSAAGACWLDQEVVKDGPIITSRSPDDLPAFFRALSDSLRGNALQWGRAFQ